jgi:hypothetical protein
MALQCTIIQKKEWYPDAVLGGPAENQHDSCAILEVVIHLLKLEERGQKIRTAFSSGPERFLLEQTKR